MRVDGKERCGESGRQGRIIVARMMVRVYGKGGSLLHG